MSAGHRSQQHEVCLVHPDKDPAGRTAGSGKNVLMAMLSDVTSAKDILVSLRKKLPSDETFRPC